MNEKLIMSLIEKQAIRPKTQITAVLSTVDFAGQRHSMLREFSLHRILENKDGIFFVASINEASISSKALYKVPLLSVRAIDGMDIKSLAKVYGLRPDGTPSEAKICPITGEPLRRGRKPKWVKEKLKELEKESI